MIAVVDSKNQRVQIFNYYWSESPLYCQEVKLMYVIGGYKSCCGVKLIQPTAVSYSSTGDLAICDPGLKSVLVLSSAMLLLRTITVPFINSIPKDDLPSPYHIFPAAPPCGQIPMDPSTNSPLPSNASLIDRKPVDVAFSSDGKIAVMYRRGGILIFKPIKRYSTGFFDSMPVTHLPFMTLAYRHSFRFLVLITCYHIVTIAITKHFESHVSLFTIIQGD